MAPPNQKLHHACRAGAVTTLMLLSPMTARADFFDGARKAFQTDIPHFFQDDIPCAFGGGPTSGAKTSCKSPDHPAANPAPVHAKDSSLRNKPNDNHEKPPGAER